MASQVRHEEFSHRLRQACENNPNVPDLNHGRLAWFADEFDSRYGVTVTGETVRKWLAGLARPHPHSKVEQLAEILRVDVAWLATGARQNVTRKQIEAKRSTASGAVNVVAGLIQMSGGHPAFPKDDDAFAKDNHIDLYAILRGVQHAIHVTVAGPNGKVEIPVDMDNAKIVVLMPKAELTFEVYRVTREAFRTVGKVQGSTVSAYLDHLDAIRLSDLSHI